MSESTEAERRFPRRFLLAIPGAAAAVGVTQVVAGRADAAPGTTAWKLGGNPSVATNGSNYLGTNNPAPIIFKTKPNATTPVTEQMRVNTNGRVGIGQTNPGARLDVKTATPAVAVRGTTTNTTADSTGVRGVSPNVGVYGDGGNYGVIGEADSYGGYFFGSTGAYASGSGYGVYGDGNVGVYGIGSFGVQAFGSNRGVDSDGHIGMYGRSSDYVGVAGDGTFFGVVGQSVASSGTSYAVFGDSRTATGGTAYAGGFAGNVHVYGTLSKNAGAFKIDHPLAPEKKWLSHSFVESPDMMNVYNGTVVLDDAGRATVELPDYFAALNRDYRYQLTPIGRAAPDLHVARKVRRNRFRIAGGHAGQEVSWQVTGIRQDTYAREHPIVVETAKSGDEVGTRLTVPAGSSARPMPIPAFQRGADIDQAPPPRLPGPASAHR